MKSYFWKDDISQSGRLHTHTFLPPRSVSSLLSSSYISFEKEALIPIPLNRRDMFRFGRLHALKLSKADLCWLFRFFFAFWKKGLHPGERLPNLALSSHPQQTVWRRRISLFGLECVKHEIGVLAPAVCPLIDVRILRVHLDICQRFGSDRP